VYQEITYIKAKSKAVRCGAKRSSSERHQVGLVWSIRETFPNTHLRKRNLVLRGVVGIIFHRDWELEFVLSQIYEFMHFRFFLPIRKGTARAGEVKTYSKCIPQKVSCLEFVRLISQTFPNTLFIKARSVFRGSCWVPLPSIHWGR